MVQIGRTDGLTEYLPYILAAIRSWDVLPRKVMYMVAMLVEYRLPCIRECGWPNSGLLTPHPFP